MKWGFLFLLFFFGLDSFAQSDSCMVYIPNIISMDCETGEDYRLKVYVSCPMDSCRLRIFDKWGELLHDSADKQPGWDGSKQADGIYFYKFEGVFTNKEKFEYKGTLHLVR